MGPLSALTLATTAALGGLAARGLAQPAPVEGIRPAPVRTHAIVGATVVTSPGHILEDATIVIRDGVIEAVGPDVVGPPQARIWPADDLTVYPGLIDMALLVEVRDLPDASADAGAHWNKRVHPQVAMSSRPGPDRSLREALRKIGFTAAAVYPAKGIFRGSGTVIALADEDEHVLVYRPQADMAIGLNDRAPRGDRSYPNSLMGVMALVRQTLHDTRWYAECQSLWRLDPQGQEPPVHSDALGALADVVTGGQRVQFDVTDELTALRAARLAEESQLEAMLLGSGYEFRHLDSVAATGLAVIVPLSYPDRPKVSSLLEADDVSLREMMTWEQAPTNARRLVEAGVTVALTTHRLDKRSEFPAALSKTITHGLGEDDALAALTTTPARLLVRHHGHDRGRQGRQPRGRRGVPVRSQAQDPRHLGERPAARGLQRAGDHVRRRRNPAHRVGPRGGRGDRYRQGRGDGAPARREEAEGEEGGVPARPARVRARRASVRRRRVRAAVGRDHRGDHRRHGGAAGRGPVPVHHLAVNRSGSAGRAGE
jgi:hypothetical protein